MSDYLTIPKRDRSKYEYVYCGKCKNTVNQSCGLSKKKISTCRYSRQHRYRASVYIPGSGNQRIRKNFVTRDYKEFQKQAREFVEQLEALNFQIEDLDAATKPKETIEIETRKAKPVTVETLDNSKTVEPLQPSDSITFLAVVQGFLDWLHDINVPKHKHKKLSEKYLKEIALYLKHFATAMVKNGMDPSTMPMADIGDDHVGAFHVWLETETNEDGTLRFSNHSYNKGMAFMRKLYRYIIKHLKYDLEDPFIDVKEKNIKPSNVEMIELEEFKAMLRLVTKTNGMYKKFDRGKPRPLNHFRPWLKNALRLLLESGERRDGVVLMRWNQVSDEYIDVPNYKVGRIMKEENRKHRKVPMTRGLKKLLAELGYEKNKGSDNYIIAPEQLNRTTLKNWMTRAFTHYWKLTGIEKKVTLKHLRKTYITLMYGRFGQLTGQITDQRMDTIEDHYLSNKKLMKQAQNLTLEELDNLNNLKKR